MDWKAIINNLLEKMTQRDLAEKIACSQPFISLLSRGKRKKVDFEMGQKIIALCVLHGVEQKKALVTTNN